ncbi:MAG TPA: choice-of-anchor V domain-containing protein [Bryobacteraceae bacterium]|nr:choice-of-anchor V domain-containing protein [Bryobacteraceae bacterium]
MRCALVVVAIAPIVIYAYEYGPDPGKTGAPGDNPTGCIQSGCHSGTPNSFSGSVSIKASGGASYVPGQTQQIQVTITDATERKYGFQLSARVDSSPTNQGAGLLAPTDSLTQVKCSNGSISPPTGCPSQISNLQWIEHTLAGYNASATPPGYTYSFNWTAPATDVGTVTLYAAGNAVTGTLQPGGTHVYLTKLQLSPAAANPNAPSISAGGVVPVYSSSTTIQPGEWVSIYGSNLAGSTATWNGDFPTMLGGTSVTVNNKPAYLWFVSPGQINLQAPDDTATGSVNVVVTNANGTATSTVTLGQFGPSFSLLDGKHVAGIILRPDGSGSNLPNTPNSYDIVGPTGSSLGYKTVAAKAGDSLVLFGVGFGPTNPAVAAGKVFAGAAATTTPVTLLVNNQPVTPAFSGLTSAGLYQFNLTVPSGLGAGDVALSAMAGGLQTPSGVVLSLQ